MNVRRDRITGFLRFFTTVFDVSNKFSTLKSLVFVTFGEGFHRLFSFLVLFLADYRIATFSFDLSEV